MTSMPIFSHMLEPETEKKFFALCKATEYESVAHLIDNVDEHVERVRLALKTNEFLDIATTQRIAGIIKIY